MVADFSFIKLSHKDVLEMKAKDCKQVWTAFVQSALFASYFYLKCKNKIQLLKPVKA